MLNFGLFIECMNDKGNLLSVLGYIINNKIIVVVIMSAALCKVLSVYWVLC